MLTTIAAAAELKITRRRVLALIKSGRLPATRFDNAWVIEPSSLKLVKNRKPGPPRKVK